MFSLINKVEGRFVESIELVLEVILVAKRFGVLDLDLVANLVVNDVPVLAFDMIIDFLVVGPVNVLVRLLPLLGDPLKVLERVSSPVLVERLTLSELLQHLISRW